MKVYVYLIYFPTSKRSNPYYVGVAKNLERRMLQHFDSKFQVGNALRKYDDWVIKKLHTCKTYEEAFKIEIEEIRNFNCIALNGYNMTRGGDGIFNPCEIIKKKLRNARKGKKPCQGHKHSKETKRKMSEAHKGKKLRPFSEEHKNNIRKSRLGKHLTDEAKRKVSEFQQGRKQSKLHILKRTIARTKTNITKLEEFNV